MNKLRKIFTISVMAITVLSMSVVVAPQVDAAASAGDLIKMDGLSSVYYLGTDSKRYVFPNEKTYFSWYSDFSSVVTVPQSELESYPLGSNVTVRPGTQLVKITTNPNVYAVTKGGTLELVPSEAVAAALYGASWASRVIDVPDAFFTNYKMGGTLSATAYPQGTLIQKPGSADIYYINADGTASKIANEAALAANRFQSSNVITTAADFLLPTAGTEIAGAESDIIDTSSSASGTGITPGTGTGLTVALAGTTAASATIISGQGRANLASFNVTASNDGDVKVTTFKVKRIGVSADSHLSNVYLYEGSTRLTDNASVSSGYATWNNSAGIITVPAGTTKTISVLADIDSSATGNIGVAVNAASDIVTNGASVSGSFPATGNLMSVTSASDKATVALGATVSGATTVDAGETGFSAWKNTLTVGNKDVYLKYLKLRVIGTYGTADLKNIQLYANNVAVGSAVSVDTNGYVTFDLMSSPVTLKTGSKTLEVKLDVEGGSSKTFYMSLRQATDIVVDDSNYNVGVLVTGTLPASSAEKTINSGSLSVTKMSDSPSGNVVKDASNIALAKYEFKAYGENVKVEHLRVAVVESDGDTAFTLRNGALYANGVQVGSTAAIAATTDSTAGYTDFNLGSSLVVVPGTPVVLEVKADLYDSDGANGVDADDTLQVRLVKYTSGAQRQTSLGYIDVPTNNVDAGTVTVKTGSLSGAANASYGAQNTIAGVGNYKLGSYIISAAAGEDVNISNFTVAVTFTDNASSSGETDTAATTMSDIYVKYGDVQTTPKSSVSTSNSFSVSKTMTNNTQMTVEVWATINSAPEATDTISTTLAVSATTANSVSTADVSAVTGQTITIQDGTITAAVDGTAPNTAILIANATNQDVARFKFTTQYAPVTLKDITIKMVTAASARSVKSAALDLNNDGTADTPAVQFALSGGQYYAAFVGVNSTIPSNTNQVVRVLLNINDVTTNGTSGDDVAVNLYSYKKSIAGTDTTVTPSSLNGNAMIVRNTKPTVTKVSTSGSLLNGTEMDAYKFKIAADANANVAVKQMKFAVTLTDNGGASVLSLGSFKLFRGSDDITANVAITDASSSPQNLKAGGSSFGESSDSPVVILFTSEEVIEKGTENTYTLKLTPAGFTTGADDDTFSIQMSGDASSVSYKYLVDSDATASEKVAALGDSAGANDTAANFIWSDNSVVAHSSTLTDETGGSSAAGSSADWTNGYLIKNDLPGSAVSYNN